eukprot:TRINITY_DN1377_c0_g1_i2.p1 TRINITY_DN1377_c0_g1~~TRINITY_DN1377_c0_g1_i2.p1  ORF type:complete len:530 (-),score=54.37 TRINITY_DN1377_c0_g1_i2:164-1600(-)
MAVAGRWLAGAARFAFCPLRRLVGAPGCNPEQSNEQQRLQAASGSAETLPQTPRGGARRDSLVQRTPPLFPLGTEFTPVARGAAPRGSLAPRALWEDAESSQPCEGDVDFWRVQLEAIYCRRNPYKFHLIPKFLKKYRGREVLLYRKVCHQYDLDPMRFYTDPDAWPDESDPTLHEEDTNEALESVCENVAQASSSVAADQFAHGAIASAPCIAPQASTSSVPVSSSKSVFSFKFDEGSRLFGDIKEVPRTTRAPTAQNPFVKPGCTEFVASSESGTPRAPPVPRLASIVATSACNKSVGVHSNPASPHEVETSSSSPVCQKPDQQHLPSMARLPPAQPQSVFAHARSPQSSASPTTALEGTAPTMPSRSGETLATRRPGAKWSASALALPPRGQPGSDDQSVTSACVGVKRPRSAEEDVASVVSAVPVGKGRVAAAAAAWEARSAKIARTAPPGGVPILRVPMLQQQQAPRALSGGA